MKIDFNYFDEQTKMEKIINVLMQMKSLGNDKLLISTYEDQLIFVLSIITILYKEEKTNEYLINKFKNINPTPAQTLINQNKKITHIIEELIKCIDNKKIQQARKKITDNLDYIEPRLERFYKMQRKNYILNAMPLEIIIKTKKTKELLKLNPLVLNQILLHKPLTQEETIIYDIIQYYENIKSNPNIYSTIKKLLYANYDENNLKQTILFIINNTYQEMLEHPYDNNINMIVPVIENEKVPTADLIQYFIENDKLSDTIISSFIKYNRNIKEGHLQELKTKKSYQYIRK